MPDAVRQKFGPDEYRALGSLVVTLLIMGALLFVPAGTLGWARAWWYLAVFVVGVLIALVYIWRVDPELFVVRQRPQAGTKTWDLGFVAVTVTALAAILPIAGLDYRFNWSELPDWLVWLGFLIFAASFALSTWAPGVNRHFELTVRIQTDRDHRVVDTGPYALIRHPGYAGAVGLAVGTALALGSLFALIPALVCIIGLVFRSLAEEETLRAELPGYADYMQRVRYRWVPGIW